MATTRVADLIVIASRLSGISVADISGKRRFKPIIRVRQAVMYVARKQGVHSFPQIGRAIGGRDHSTVIHGIEAAEIIAERDVEYRNFLLQLEAAASIAEPFQDSWGGKPNFEFTIPAVKWPMFEADTDPDDEGLKFHAKVKRGSTALLRKMALAA